jgi:dTDP-4-dehydrorhamnose 3,5-epimerase
VSPTPQTTPIDGALVVPLTKHEDSRGWFLEARKESWFRELGGKPSMQTNIVYSRQGVIRGLHFHELGQDDLFFCAQGMVRVVLFDRREDSPTHGTAWSIDIGDENPCAVYVPGRTAHG